MICNYLNNINICIYIYTTILHAAHVIKPYDTNNDYKYTRV